MVKAGPSFAEMPRRVRPSSWVLAVLFVAIMPTVASAQRPDTTRQATDPEFVPLMIGGTAGSAIGGLAGWVLFERSDCCANAGDDAIALQFLTAAATATIGTAVGTFVAGHAASVPFGATIGPAAIGLLGALVGGTIGVEAAQALGVTNDGFGGVIGASIGQGALAAFLIKTRVR